MHSGFTKASSLVKHSERQPSSPTASSPELVQAVERTSTVASSKSPAPSQPQKSTSDGSPLSDSEGSQPLSRQSTETISEFTSSSSSFASSSFDIGDSGDTKLRRILTMIENWEDVCVICWARRETSQPHPTWRCRSQICSGNEWKSFKMDLPFPKGKLCYFCLCLYDEPFNHTRAPPGSSQTHNLCNFPDVLKQLVFVLYHDASLRRQVFAKLRTQAPATSFLYKRYITKKPHGELFGAYEVVNAYLEVRESSEVLG